MNSDTKSGVRILIYAAIVILSYLAAFLLTPSAWELYTDYKGLGPDSVGSEGQANTPVAHSIAEMQQLDRFVVYMHKQHESQDIEFFSCEKETYAVLILDSGERIASKIYMDSMHYNPKENCWDMPIGRLLPWDLTQEGQESVQKQNLSLSTVDFYVDMEGSQGMFAYTQEGFVRRFQFLASWCFIGIFIVIWRILSLLRRHRWEVNRPKNDVEFWIAGTHALWGLAFARACKMGYKKKEKDPIRIGGAPRSPKAKQIVRSILHDQWDIASYESLLETVSYMSEGEGFSRCQTQSARAWQLCRSTSLLGMAYIAGWADRKEIIERSLKICLRIQETFSSWDELYVSFLEHYAMWRSADEMTAAAQTDIQQRVDIYWELKQRKKSPCKLPWNLNLKFESTGGNHG